ncbi:MAG: PH domain-containing protein [Clostridia bacterium]|nr:PH domain-containing protein [Clostridia bacterium]
MKRFDKGYIYSSLLTDLFYSFVAVFVFLQDFFLNEDSNPDDVAAAIPVFVIGYVVVYLCFVAYRILYYRVSGYELTEKEIKCNRGVLFRKRSVLDYKKVHAINKKQNLIHRIFGLAVLTVDSGSANTSHQAEITIIEKEKVVDALLSELNSLKENGVRSDAGETKTEEVLLSDKDSLYRFTSGKKMLYTLINIATTVFFTALFAVLAIIVLGVCKGLLQLDSLGTWGEYFLGAILITVAVMLLLSIFSFIGSIIHSFVGYYNFTITKHDHNIQISYGILEKHTNTFRYDRIKAVKISQGLVQRMLGFVSIRLEVIGYTVNSGDDDKNADLGVLVPFCKYDEIGEILERVLPDYIPDEKQTRSVAFFPFVSWFLLIFGVISGITLMGTVAVMAVLNAPSAAISAVAISIFGVALVVIVFRFISAVFRYHTNGLAVRDGKITAYSGGFTKCVTVFQAKNLIAVENVTTPLRKKQGIASLVMHLKTNAHSNEVKVHIQRDTLSDELENMLTF